MHRTSEIIFFSTLALYLITLITVSYVGVYLTYVAVPVIIISGLIMYWTRPREEEWFVLAQIFPSLENIERLKVSPTNGEWFLINHLIDQFDDDVEIYFQPFLNGDRPDIILMQKNAGVAVIEVKDWDFGSYNIDINNKWSVSNINQRKKSPFQQVFSYKTNLFKLHISGLLEKKIRNKKLFP